MTFRKVQKKRGQLSYQLQKENQNHLYESL